MAWICPADGHIVGWLNPPTIPPSDPKTGRGYSRDDPRAENASPFCAGHGARVFRDCPRCKKRWKTVVRGNSQQPTHGADFCGECGEPAPWLTRDDLMGWLKSQVKMDTSIPTATRYELLDDLAALAVRTRDDDKTVATWKKLREKAPRLCERMRGPILDALMSEGIQRLVGLI